MATLAFDRVWKSFGDVEVLRDLTLTVADGEFLVLVGPSGCGKSTALRLVAGLEEPTRGEIRIGDRVVNGVEPKDRDIAMVFQNYALYPHMTVRENLGFGLRMRKTPRPEIERRVAEAARMLGLGELLERLPKQLSGGQRQRVAVGRAVVRQPTAFLFDEPLSNLDAKLRLETRAEIVALHAQLHTTTLYVTHDQVEAMTMGQRLAVLHRGQLQQVGTPLEVYDRPANLFVAGFIGTPPMNFAPGTLRESGTAVEVMGLTIPLGEELAAAARRSAPDVVVGLRPEALQEAGADERQAIEGRIELAEALGHETLVHARVADARWVAKLPAARRFVPGDAIRLSPNAKGVHLFAGASERRLG